MLNHIAKKTSNTNLLIQLDSDSQKKEFAEKIQSNLMGFLKEELSNYGIELAIEVLEVMETKNLIYTANDKYKYLAEQNPALESLKKKFSLDFE